MDTTRESAEFRHKQTRAAADLYSESRNPQMKVLPEPSMAQGSCTSVPLMGTPNTWPPPRSSQPATIMAAISMFLLP